MTKGSGHCVYVYRGTNEIIKSTADLIPAKVEYRKERKGYRLLTEAEWEYAARFQGRDNTNALRYGYDYLTHLDSFSGAKENYQNSREKDRVAWYYANSENKTHPVGQKAANYAGIYDMSGNVYEWCYDGWEEYPKTGVNPIGLVDSDRRILRGGSWERHVTYDYAYVVGMHSHGNWTFHSHDRHVGFRIACN